MIPTFGELPYCERLKLLNLWTLEERRNHADLIDLYKILFKQVSAVKIRELFEKASYGNSRGNSLKLRKTQLHLDLRN